MTDKTSGKELFETMSVHKAVAAQVIAMRDHYQMESVGPEVETKKYKLMNKKKLLMK